MAKKGDLKFSLRFNLVAAARNVGGDRYAARDESIDPRPITIYVPQRISRGRNGIPEAYIQVTFTVEQDG